LDNMSDSLLLFFKAHPILAALIIVFVLLPIIGAVVHILLKAFGRRGIDNSPTLSEEIESANGGPDEPTDDKEDSRSIDEHDK
jgi:hypothetical protein